VNVLKESHWGLGHSFLCLALLGLASAPAAAQAGPGVQGDYVGMLGPRHVKLHIVAASDGALRGTFDSLDEGALGIPCSDLRVQAGTFSFSVPAANGKWSGTIADGGATLSGIWTQVAAALPLTFKRDTFFPAAKPSAVDGIWLGPGPQSLRVQISVKSDAAGHELCTFDSVDQDDFGRPCDRVVFAPPDFSFDVPSVNGRYAGKLSADNRSLAGTFTQGSVSVALNLARQDKAIEPPPLRARTQSPAMAPVDAAGMQSVLDHDFATALKTGVLAPQTSVGVTIGVIRDGARRVFAYGSAQANSIFEIGSVTKTFTGLILAQMIEQGKVRLDQPVRELLPPGTAAKPPEREISLGDLVTQHSGLPRMPDNLHPADPANPYADYRPADLYEYVARHGLSRPDSTEFLYSNLGLGLLGQALADRAGVSYPQLLAQEVTGPLGLKDTVVSLTPEQRARFIGGHTAEHLEAHAWDHDAFAGAGAIRSTAADLLTYLEANLHPEKLPAAASTLARAIRLSHQLRDTAAPGMHIAFAWAHIDSSGLYWHNGATGGYSSYVFFDPQQDCAGVVLVNTTVGRRGSLADLIGQHIVQRFTGQPAVDL
jgi:serine-type D-Ala-D-Ala carboxypeptidase/endopeptidase